MDNANDSSASKGATATRPRRVTPTVTKTSACILCACNCGIKIDLDGRRFATIRGDKDHPTSEGYTCEKALRLDYYQNDVARLTSPLKRTPEGEYVEIGWDQAFDEIAAKLADIKERHGPGKLLTYASGQGNHMGLAGVASIIAFMESPFFSSALAQEKTGEVWVDSLLYGAHTQGDFDHAQVLFFLGKNPWQTHGVQRARPVLREAARDPERTVIVVDPRLSDTAEVANVHLRVAPGRDAWLLTAMIGVLIQEDLVDHDFLAKHTRGSEEVLKAFRGIPVAEFAEISGVPEEQIRSTARILAAAKSASFLEDLGVQQSTHSTLVSYLGKLLWILTGNFAREGCQQLHSWFLPLGVPSSGRWLRRKKNSAPLPYPVPMWAYRAGLAAVRAFAPVGKVADRAVTALIASPRFAPRFERVAKAMLDAGIGLAPKGWRNIIPRIPDGSSPVTGARIIDGQIPCNSLTEEILGDHPDRFRALFVVSGNPVHSLTDAARWREAMRALELSVVVDVAFTETAQLADYVLPAASQFEKAEATFFNLEVPRNSFQLRKPVLDPLPGTMIEAEMFARLSQRFGILDEETLERLRRAWKSGPNSYLLALGAAIAAKPSRALMITTIVHETIGHDMDEQLRPAAILWFACIGTMFLNHKGLARVGFTGKGLEPAIKLYEEVLRSPTGVVFTEQDPEDSWDYVLPRGKKITMAIKPLLKEVAELSSSRRSWTSDEFPLVLIAGHRRSFTANTIIRDPAWRRRGGDGALQISKPDATDLGLSDGDQALLTTKGGSVVVTIEIGDIMLPGNIALPNGMGLAHPGVQGGNSAGVGPNELTSVEDRDPIAGTPWHKHVAARLEAISAG